MRPPLWTSFLFLASPRNILAAVFYNTTSVNTSTMTVGEAILQGLGASIVATSSSSTAQITPAPTGILGNATTTLLTGNFTLPFGEQSTIAGPQDNPFEPAKWYTDSPEVSAARSCYSALTSHELASADFYTSAIQGSAWPIINTTKTFVYTVPTTTTIYPANPSTYKLCDGSPRVDIKPETSSWTYLSTDYFTTTAIATPTQPAPKPCNGSAQTCYEWFRYSNLTFDWYTTNTTDSQLMNRECGYPAHFDPASDNATNWPCLIAGGPVQLYYFPVDSDPSQGLCNTTRTSVNHPATTPPPTIVTDGYTLTSGSVYVSFSTLFAYYDGFGGYHFGTTFSNLLLPFASSEISTGCGGFGGLANAATQLNYADLNSPVPASAYACAGRCKSFYSTAPTECKTIWDDFNPQMQIPTRLTDLHPAWKTCKSYDPGLVNEWLFDPPIALTQQTAPAQLTAPGYAPVESPTQGGNTIGGVTTPVGAGGGMPTWPTHTAQPAYDNLGPSGPTETQLSVTRPVEPTVLVVGSVTFTLSALPGANAVVVDGHTMTQGGAAATISGQEVSYGSSGLVAVATSGAAAVSTTSSERTTLPPRSSISTSAGVMATTTTTSGAERVHLDWTRLLSALAMLMGIMIM